MTYALFAEVFATLIRPEGRAGGIVQTGIATDSSNAAFFGWLIDQRRLATLIDFENRRKIFPAVDSRVKFSILTMADAGVAEFAFFLLDPADLEHKERRFNLSPEQIARINPNTKTAPIFRSRADAELTASIYDRVPVLIEERAEENGGDINPWGLVFQRMFDMSGDSGLFGTAGQLAEAGCERNNTDWVTRNGAERRVPLYEAKMIHHFDHRWATYAVACKDGRVVGNDRDVRVFAIEHIKGLEFEAVFFVGLDRTIQDHPDLYTKYLYVGATRAATYLGVTFAGGVPVAVRTLAEHFADSWSV